MQNFKILVKNALMGSTLEQVASNVSNYNFQLNIVQRMLVGIQYDPEKVIAEIRKYYKTANNFKFNITVGNVLDCLEVSYTYTATYYVKEYTHGEEGIPTFECMDNLIHCYSDYSMRERADYTTPVEVVCTGSSTFCPEEYPISD